MHIVDVDQSGRFEATGQDTVLAFSNSIQFAVLIPASVKRNCIKLLRESGRPSPTLHVQLFATGLYFLLRNHIERMSVVLIDTEYQGKNAQIKEHLLNLLRRAGYTVYSEQIQFGYIGKQSQAHVIALATFRRDVQPNLVLTLEDMLGEFKLKRKNRG